MAAHEGARVLVGVAPAKVSFLAPGLQGHRDAPPMSVGAHSSICYPGPEGRYGLGLQFQDASLDWPVQSGKCEAGTVRVKGRC